MISGLLRLDSANLKPFFLAAKACMIRNMETQGIWKFAKTGMLEVHDCYYGYGNEYIFLDLHSIEHYFRC